MHRPGPVIAIVVLELLGSVFCLGGGVVALLSTALLAASPARHAALGPLVGIGIFIILLACWGAITALGLLWLRLWALISTLLFAIGLICGGAGALAGAFNPMPGLPAPTVALAHALDFLAGLVMLGLGVWWVAYFVRARTHAAFFAARPDGQPPRLPISLNVIAWVQIAAGGTSFAVLLWLGSRVPFMLGAYLISGNAAEAACMLVAAAGLVIGVGLLERRRWARLAGVVWVAVETVWTAALWLSPGAIVKMVQHVSRVPDLAIQPPPLLAIAVTLTLGLGGGLAQIYFLWTRRAAFQPPASGAVAAAQASAT